MRTRYHRLICALPMVLALLVLAAATLQRLGPHWWPERRPPAAGASYEEWARREFLRCHPGDKPRNWEVARAAERLYKAKPMGKFVLGLRKGYWGNDCSDFVACAIDDGLGVRARFRRGSDQHLLGEDRRLWEESDWTPGMAVQPGDVVSVRHSPWYAPTDASCSHVGIVGTDGMVYDFVKLRRWSDARYGRSDFDWFVRHNPSPGQVVIRRLNAAYRYRVDPLPQPRPLQVKRPGSVGSHDPTEG